MSKELIESHLQYSKEELLKFVRYEISSSFWASMIWFKWGQDLASEYFANKAKRKYLRYLTHLYWRKKSKEG